jgi:hypothetical protein
VLPPWDGKVVPAAQAAGLLAVVGKLPARLLDTALVRRVEAILEFLCKRGSAHELDDQMRALADNDTVALEQSYSLIRFITWAIPILGFLGTVLGITGAIANVSPEQLENDLNSVTSGLALAFDATALALGLTMLTMFCTFLVDRVEQGLLENVDRFAERQLAHRFERSGAEAAPFIAALSQQSEVLLSSSEKLVRSQAELWHNTLVDANQRRADAEGRNQKLVSAALESALDKTLHTHAERLADMDKQARARGTELAQLLAELAGAVRDTGREQQQALAQVAGAIGVQATALGKLQEEEKNLLYLQELLNQNLAALGRAGDFEQAVHSLTAAIHLLTARPAVVLPSGTASRLQPRTGAAA